MCERPPADAMTCRPACGLYLLVGAPLCLAFLGQNDLIRMEPIVALGAEHRAHAQHR